MTDTLTTDNIESLRGFLIDARPLAENDINRLCNAALKGVEPKQEVAGASEGAKRLAECIEALNQLLEWNEGIAAGRGDCHVRDHIKVICKALKCHSAYLTPNTDREELPSGWLAKEVDAIGPETDKWPDGIKQSFEDATQPTPQQEAEPVVASPTMPNWAQPADDRPKRGGWAPGNYLNTCAHCETQFVGAKRAQSCADCAYEKAPSTAPPKGEDEATRLRRIASDVHDSFYDIENEWKALWEDKPHRVVFELLEELRKAADTIKSLREEKDNAERTNGRRILHGGSKSSPKRSAI